MPAFKGSARPYETEAEVLRYLRAECRKMKWMTRRAKWIGRRGAPDLRILGLAWVETKSTVGRLSPHQEREIAEMRRKGERVFVVSSRAEVDDMLFILRALPAQ